MDASLKVSEISFCLILPWEIEPEEVLREFGRHFVRKIGSLEEGVRSYTLKILPEEKEKLLDSFVKFCEERKLSFQDPREKAKTIIEDAPFGDNPLSLKNLKRK